MTKQFRNFYVEIDESIFKKKHIPKDVIDIKEWCKALRSGKYIQGKDRLITTIEEREESAFDGDKHCCLGVLCDLKGIPLIDKENNRSFGCLDLVAHKSQYFYLEGHGVINKAGVEIKSKSNDLTILTLASLNDNYANFEEIAQVIELFFTNEK